MPHDPAPITTEALTERFAKVFDLTARPVGNVSPLGNPAELPGFTSPLTETEQAASCMVMLCFGGTSTEYLRFVKYLVVEVHGLPWDDTSPTRRKADDVGRRAAAVGAVDQFGPDAPCGKPCGHCSQAVVGAAAAEVAVAQGCPQRLTLTPGEDI